MKLSDNARTALNTVVAKFQAGDLSPVVEIARLKYTDDRPFGHWSFANQIMAYIQTGSLDCRGYRQWQAAGRQVTAGSHAAYILGPVTKQIADPDTGETQPIAVGFTPIAVFPYDATSGADLPDLDQPPATLPPLADVAARLGVQVTWTPGPDFYNHTADRINVGTHDTSIFFHELAHAAHARIEATRGGQHPHQETVAEFTAAVLMQLYGYNYTGNCWAYIAGYNTDPLTAIYKALATVEKVLDLLLN